jgi:hypothetical protein
MAADKEIMKQIEALRLDRPGRIHQAALEALDLIGAQLDAALRELAATYREEAELWERSGAKGWKSSAADAALIAQAIDSVAAQLDNAGGGAALSVSEPERKTAHAWNDDPRIDPFVVSWSDFGSSAHAQGIVIDPEALITRAEFEQIRDGGAVTIGRRPAATTPERLDALVASAVAEGRGTLRDVAEATVGHLVQPANDVAAYLRGDDSALPGALTPSSVTSVSAHPDGWLGALPGEPLAALVNGAAEFIAEVQQMRTSIVPVADTSSLTDEQRAKLDSLKDPADAMPKTWESDKMTADGLRPPGTPLPAPTLGQPGDNSGGGYSHDYVPPGGRRLTFADLLQPVPAAALPPHLSHSQGNTITDCAAKYRMQRVDQLPQIPQWANIGGTAFHAAVEAIERTLINAAATGRLLKLDGYDVELGWKEHFDREIAAVATTTTVPRSVWRASRRGAEGEAWWWVNGPKFLRAYLDARPDDQSITVDSGGTPAIEFELTADVPTPYGPIPFTAKLDRVTVRSDGAIVIRDYKTSYERPTDTTQLGDYAHVMMLAGVNLHGATKILGSYFDARRGTWTEPVDLLAAHPFEAFQYRVTSAHAQKRALTTGPTPARPSSYCGGCAVRYACPIMAAKS